jgi:hypothetical protein
LQAQQILAADFKAYGNSHAYELMFADMFSDGIAKQFQAE